MAAIVRVKRSRCEHPANTIVVSCKKAKLDQGIVVDTPEDVKGVFKFAATLDIKSDEVGPCVKEAIKREKLQRELKQHSTASGIIQRSRGQQKQQIISNRFKLISEKRAVDLKGLDFTEKDVSPKSAADTASSQSAAVVTTASSGASSPLSDCRYRLLDVDVDNSASMTLAPPPPMTQTSQEQKEVVTCNGVPMIREKAPQPEPQESSDYVYDIYYMNKSDFDFRALENILAIEATREELVYDNYREEDEEVYDDEDNADDESNWRNDYPDEDPQYYEHWETGGEYDDIGGRDFSYDDWGTSQMLRNQLKLTEDDYSDTVSSSDEDAAYFGEAMHPAELSSALESYEKYKERVNSHLDKDTG